MVCLCARKQAAFVCLCLPHILCSLVRGKFRCTPIQAKMKYATFGQRFLASLIDFLLLLPLGFFFTWLESMGKATASLAVIPSQVVFPAYCIWLHARNGRTLGKEAQSIRVVRKTGGRIGWREAWLRSSVDVAISIAGAVSIFYAIAMLPAELSEKTGQELSIAIVEQIPGWTRWLTLAATVWYWSELIVMLMNKERRALHDYLAGTVVVNERER
jgi:uncharacterized RDD family membrane protein YckC